MGTMLQEADPTLEDFQGHEGCNEILNVSRPDIVRKVHDQYLAAGVDAIETNTFGANWANLAEYGIEDRIYELAYAGAVIAREAADAAQTPDKPRFVLGSLGPGTKLPSLGHTTYGFLKQAYHTASKGLLDGKCDALLIETTQDLLQAKAAVNGARQAIAEADFDVVLIVQVTVETTGTMLLGSEIGAALNALEPLEIDLIGLNCATGPAEMSEHLRYLSKFAHCAISVMPNAGLPILGAKGAEYPLGPDELAQALETFVGDYGISLIGGCCGTTPEHLRAVVTKLGAKPIPVRPSSIEPGASSLYQYVPFRQDKTYLAIGERTNANGSRAFRDALVAEDWEACVEIARDQIRDGAHMLDLSVDYVGRDGAKDMTELATRFATASTLPIVLDSTEPGVLKAGLEALGGRSVINSVNYEDGDGPTSRFARIMPLVQEHGASVVALTIDEEGQARDCEWKLRVARRLITDLTQNWQMKTGDILIDCLTFPIATGQEETRRDGIETINAIRSLKNEYPEVQTTLGVSNVSFGLNPAARVVLNSVFLHECVNAGLDSAIVHPSKITPLARIDERQREVALDLIYDRRRYEGQTCTYDPLTEFLQLFEGVELAVSRNVRAAELAALPLTERLQRRIIDGEKVGLTDELCAGDAGGGERARGVRGAGPGVGGAGDERGGAPGRAGGDLAGDRDARPRRAPRAAGGGGRGGGARRAARGGRRGRCAPGPRGRGVRRGRAPRDPLGLRPGDAQARELRGADGRFARSGGRVGAPRPPGGPRGSAGCPSRRRPPHRRVDAALGGRGCARRPLVPRDRQHRRRRPGAGARRGRRHLPAGLPGRRRSPRRQPRAPLPRVVPGDAHAVRAVPGWTSPAAAGRAAPGGAPGAAGGARGAHSTVSVTS